MITNLTPLRAVGEQLENVTMIHWTSKNPVLTYIVFSFQVIFISKVLGIIILFVSLSVVTNENIVTFNKNR